MTTLQTRRPGSMPQWQRMAFWPAVVICSFSGLSYLIAREFFSSHSFFGNSKILAAHGVSAYFIVFLLGSMATGHVRLGLRLRKNRLSGVGNLIAMSLLVITGWGLYYGPEEIRDGVVLLHWLCGSMFLLILFWHLIPKNQQTPLNAK